MRSFGLRPSRLFGAPMVRIGAYSSRLRSNTGWQPRDFHFYRPDRGHWVRVRLIAVIPSLCPTEASAHKCPVTEQENFQFGPTCLGNELTFDSTYQPDSFFYHCSLEPIEDGGRPALAQGLSAGRAFVDYTIARLNSIVLPGKYWLEVEVNVGRTIVESDYTNNIARALIEL